MTYMNVRNDVFLGCQEGSGLGSTLSTTFKYVDITKFNPPAPHLHDSGWVGDTRFDVVMSRYISCFGGDLT